MAGRAYDTIHIDGVGGTTADTRAGFDVTSNITLGVGGTLTAEVITFLTQIDLAIDTHAYKFWDLEFELDLMTQMPLMERGADRTAYVVAQKADNDCVTLIDNFSQTVGTLAAALTDGRFSTSTTPTRRRRNGSDCSPPPSRFHCSRSTFTGTPCTTRRSQPPQRVNSVASSEASTELTSTCRRTPRARTPPVTTTASGSVRLSQEP